MPSEQRLHPASVLFAFAKSAKAFLLPGLLLLITNRSSGGPDGMFGGMPRNWEFWLMLLVIPSAIASIVRYLSYRIRYEGTELVIRTGIFFRNERHVPYERIQNLDAVQNVFHRALGVVEVRVETGGGREPEARISVLPAAAFTEMRRRVFEGRERTSASAASPPEDAAPVSAPRLLLHLPLRELLLFGFLENRGLVIIGAAYGVAWELGVFEGMWEVMFDSRWYSRIVPTEVADAVAKGSLPPIRALAVLAAGIAVLLLLVRLVSMVWGATRLFDFRLVRVGEDLHTTYGLLTRVATTIPLRRVQTITFRQGPLHRVLDRLSMQVETAGSAQPGSGEGRSAREWLAPLIREREGPDLAREVMPDLELAALVWQPPHPRAFRRAVKPPVVLTVLFTALIGGMVMGWRALAALALGCGWSVVWARQYVKRLGWATTDNLVAFKSGWLWRSVTVAPIAKIQAVTARESPFDRRAEMARLVVDTAGAGERSHRVNIPYLPRDTARELHRRLAWGAARTAFTTR